MRSRIHGWQRTLLGAALATWLAGCGSSGTVGGAASTNVPQFSTTVLGDLVFGPINLLPTRKFQVKAIYTPGQSPPGTWMEPVQNLLDTSDFDLP